jgi:hypothetical protein
MKKIVLDEKHNADILKNWFEEANNVKNTDELSLFISKLLNEYTHDYGTIVHACSAAMLAALSCINKDENQGGITGFQASYIVWQLIPKLTLTNFDLGGKIVAYTDMLFPQYQEKFEKIISKKTFEALQTEAKKRLLEKDMRETVVTHMQKIADGIVPFGYEVKE